MKNKYQMMRDSEVLDKDGNAYPDLATFPIESFVVNTKPMTHHLTQLNVERFFNLIYDVYNSFDLYDDITLWLNDIEYISDKNNFGREIKLYSKIDLNNWYISGVKNEVVEIDKRVVI